MRNTKGQQTRDRIVAVAGQLFYERGYNATGLNEILEKASVPKGSFYFHFASKRELAVGVAKYHSERIEGWIRETAQDRSWNEFISALVKEMIDLARESRHRGCPLAVLGMEIAFVEPDLAGEYGKAMERVIAIFADVLQRSGLAPSNASKAAWRAFAIYQGHLQYFRLTRDIGAFDRLLNDLSMTETG